MVPQSTNQVMPEQSLDSLLNLDGVDESTLESLREAGFGSFEDIALTTRNELRGVGDLNTSTAVNILRYLEREGYREPREVTENQQQLQNLLRDLFQFDASDLDFGIYRILNQRRDIIDDFIEEDLIQTVHDALEAVATEERAELQEEVDQARGEVVEQLNEDVFTQEGDIKDEFRNFGVAEDYVDAKERLEQYEVAEETEARIFNDLYKFFSRFYERGDFHAKRRFSSQDAKFMIPYNGEEVFFHWANRDQYYVKTSENFRTYRFQADGFDVEFRVEDANVPQDNVKGDERYFILGNDPVAWDEDDEILTVTFQYRLITENEAQEFVDTYNEATGDDRVSFSHKTNTILCTALHQQILDQLDDRVPREMLQREEEGKTALMQHLTRYTSENTMDYFVHKDLGGFLRDELDYFLQNEILDTNELIIADGHRDPSSLLRARVVRKIADRIITFLDQIESFQKRLFEKRKFVTQTDYMVTLDKVPDRLYDNILTNEEQLEQWRDVYNTEEWEGTLSWQGEFTGEVLEDNPHLMIDTALFDEGFKQELLASFNDIEEAIDGALIHGENFQGTNLIKERFRGEVDSVYVDPPYNTDSSPILYKNNYKNSSWISLIHDRIRTLRTILAEQGIISFAIDDEQLAEARLLLGEMFNKEVGFAVVRSNPQSRKTKGKFSPNHEYALFYGQTSEAEPGTLGPSEQKLNRYPHEDEKGRYSWMNFIRTGSNDLREDRPKLYYPIVVNAEDELRIPEMSWSSQQGKYVIEESLGSDEQIIYPVVEERGQRIEKNWQRGPDRVQEAPEEYRVRRDSNGEINIDFKTRMDAEAAPTTWWDDNEYASANYGAAELKQLFGTKPFDFPKATKLVEDSIRAAGGDKGQWVIDPFAGSGTTASAVARINREEESNLKYVLIEMADYFDTVIRPRIQKLALSLEWDEGVPQNRDGQSHMVKYQRIESYEDALNNVVLEEPEDEQQQRLAEDQRNEYVSGYMLDFETEGASLLEPVNLKQPFDYELEIEENGTSRKPTTVDLVETFHYLLGAKVHEFETLEHQDRQYVVTRCSVETENAVDTVLTVWRDADELELEQERDWFTEQFETDQFDRIYINSESFVPGAEPTEVTFKKRMEADHDGAE